MPKVIYEQFDGGLQRGWTNISPTNRAFKNQKKNGLAAGVVNPFIAEGVLVPGIGERTAATNAISEMGTGAFAASSMLAIGDKCATIAYTDTIYITQFDSLWPMTPVGTVIPNQWPQTLSMSGIHSGHILARFDGIADYQVAGIRRQILFWRDDTDWDAAFYSGLRTETLDATERTATITIASPAVITVIGSGLGLTNGSVIRFSTSGTLPTGITAGTNYYVININIFSNQVTFNISTSRGGTPINTSGSQSGTHKIHPGLESVAMSFATGYSTNIIDKNKPIIYCTSDNGYLYFGNGNLINKYDGSLSAGTYGKITGAVVSLSPHRDIVDFIDAAGKIWILTRPAWLFGEGITFTPNSDSTSEKEISVVVWNRISTQLGLEDNIIITGCSDAFALYAFDNVIYVWTQSVEGINQLRAYDGKSFKVVADLGTYTSGIPAGVSGNSISQYRNGFLWQDQAGAVYWYGSLNPQNGVPPAVYIIATRPPNINESLSAGGATTVAGGTITRRVYTAYEGNSGNTGVYYFDPTSESEKSAFTIVYTSPIELPKLSTITGVTIFFNENASTHTGTTTVNIYNSYRKNTPPYMVTKYIDHDVDIPRGWVYFPLAMRNSNLVQLSFQFPSGIELSQLPQITRIEVDYIQTTKLR
jgi:hypothetical protein